MKLKDLSDEINFDEFSGAGGTNQKVFLSRIPYVSNLTNLKEPIPKIYTSSTLAAQLMLYFNYKGKIKLNMENFVILMPFVPMLMECDGSRLDILMCESDDISRSVMFLFKKAGRVTHFYAGICTHIRSVVLNDIFSSWVRAGVERLYMNLKKATENTETHAVYDVIDKIENILEVHNIAKIDLVVPLFGYENFIANLADQLRARVAVTGLLNSIYSNLAGTMDHFEQNTNRAKIVISNRQRSMNEIKYCFDMYKTITLKITDIAADNSNNACGYYELQWTPFPTKFDLQLLATLVHPTYIYNIPAVSAKVPSYLLRLCNTGKGKPSEPPIKFQLPAGSRPCGQPLPKETIIPNKNTSPEFSMLKKKLCYLDDSEEDDDDY